MINRRNFAVAAVALAVTPAFALAHDPADLNAIIAAMPDGTAWKADRKDYWVDGSMRISGKNHLHLDLNGAKVAGCRETAVRIDGSTHCLIMNGHFCFS